MKIKKYNNGQKKRDFVNCIGLKQKVNYTLRLLYISKTLNIFPCTQ